MIFFIYVETAENEMKIVKKSLTNPIILVVPT